MYVNERINEAYLLKAVKVNWISEEEMNEIIEFKKTVKSKIN